MGLNQKLEAAYVALQAAVARLEPMSLPLLGAELMPRFQPVPAKPLPPRIGLQGLAGDLAPGFFLMPTHDGHKQLQAYLEQLILEGLQTLEHASLICAHFTRYSSGSTLDYQATRRGLAALAKGTVEQTLWAHQPEV